MNVGCDKSDSTEKYEKNNVCMYGKRMSFPHGNVYASLSSEATESGYGI